MVTKEFPLNTLKDLRDFLNQQEETFLEKQPYILMGDDDMATRIKSVHVLTVDHINPSGECWEPVSLYAESEDPEDWELALSEPVCGRAGDFFFTGGFY